MRRGALASARGRVVTWARSHANDSGREGEGRVEFGAPRPAPNRGPAVTSPALSPPARRLEAPRITVAELTLVRGAALPRFTKAVRVAERLRLAAMSRHGQGGAAPSPVLSGKLPSGAPRRDQHRHAHYLPEARGQTDRITHLFVYAPEGLDRAEQAALAAVDHLLEHRPDGRPPRRLPVRLLALGVAEDFAAVSPLFRASRRFRSRTPFVLPRHVKPERDQPEAQLARELALRGFPAPVVATATAGVALYNPEAARVEATPWRAFRTRRHRDGGEAVVTTGATGFALSFAEPVRGPILLGYGAHYGLGQFEAVDEEG